MIQFVYVFTFFMATVIHSSSQQHYTIVSESRLFSGTDFNAVVTIHDATNDVQIRARLLRPKSAVSPSSAGPQEVEKISSIKSTGSHLIRLAVPAEWQAGYHTFEVVGSGSGVAFNHTREIFLRGSEQQRYDFVIMLDKDGHVVGDTVRYVILIVDERGKAIRDGEVIDVKTQVTDGMNVLVTQQSSRSTERGIYKGEIRLNKDCSNGALDIIVNYMGQMKSKTIALPQKESRDDLDIHLNLRVEQTSDDSKIIATVQANYKCGIAIGGNLTVLLKEVAGWFPFVLPGPDDDFCLDDKCVRFEVQHQNFHATREIRVEVPKASKAIRHFILYAKVTDQLTGRSRWAWKPVEPNFADRVDIVVAKPYFALGLPLQFQVVVKRNLGLNVSEEGNQTAKLKVRANFLDATFERKFAENREYSLPNVSERISVTVTPPEEAVAVILQVEANNRIYARKLLRTMPYNSANATLAIVTADQQVKVGSNLSVDIYATTGLDFITYQVTAIRSYSIVHWGSAKMPTKGPLRLSILVTEHFVSNFYLNVYGVTVGGEFVADNQHFVTIEENPLQMEVDVEPLERVSPGTLVNLTIKTDPHTVVLLRAFDPIEALPESGHFENTLLDLVEESEGRVWGHWKKREYEEVALLEQHIKWANGSHLQSRLFTPPRLSMFTNALLQNIPSSQNQSYRIPPSDTNRVEEQQHTRVSLSRSWLWKSVVVGEDGRVSLSVRAPDRIASWKASVFGVDQSHDIGHVALPSIHVTKPLFLLVDVPASLVRGEAVLLRVLAFQEIRRDLNVSISSTDERFQILDRYNHKVLPLYSQSIYLKANETRFNVSNGDVAEFLISPLYSGELSIEAAVVDEDGNEDIIVRTINVKNQPINERPFVYDAKEALRFDENLSCQEAQIDLTLDESTEDHRLNISFQVNSMNDQIGNLRVNACVWYYKEERSNFLLDLDLPSGFEVPKDVIKATDVTGVKSDGYKADVVDGRVRWRFENLKNDDVICTSVTAKRVFMVYNLKPAKVTAYTSFDLHKAKRAGVYYKAPSFTVL